MNKDERGFFDSLTERVLGAVFEVSNTLGTGFLEKVYERALLRELGLRGIQATAQASLAVTYKGHYVGEYFADILVEDALVIEVKCVERLANERIAQCLNYLRASRRTSVFSSIFRSPKSNGSVSSVDFRFPSCLRRLLWPSRHNHHNHSELFVSQCRQGIDPRRAAGRHPDSQQSNRSKQYRNSDEGHGIE